MKPNKRSELLQKVNVLRFEKKSYLHYLSLQKFFFRLTIEFDALLFSELFGVSQSHHRLFDFIVLH